jgi:transposase
MGAPYGQDLRDRVLGAYDRGMKTKQISNTFGVSSAWARRTKQVRREQNRITPLPMGGVRVVKVDLEQLRKLVDQQPDATIAELHQQLGIDCCSESAVGMALVRLGLSFKKRRFTRPNRTDPTLPKNAASGKRSNPHARPSGLFSSTKRGPKQT